MQTQIEIISFIYYNEKVAFRRATNYHMIDWVLDSNLSTNHLFDFPKHSLDPYLSIVMTCIQIVILAP